MGEELNKLGETLRRSNKAQPASCVWVTITEVDWDEKKLVCKGVDDDLEYYDVLLGLGSEYKRPAIGSKALIGTINNMGAASYLIHCEEVEELEIQDIEGFKIALKDGRLTLNGNNLGGLVDAKELKSQVEKNSKLLQKIQSVFSNWSPVTQDGGAALKGVSAQFLGMETADLSKVENPKIQHGDG